MAAITQRINNFLGGVSKLSDDQKLPGQVRECINGFIDPTFGLTKRPGTQFLHELVTNTTQTVGYANANWFYFEKVGNRYIGLVAATLSGNIGVVKIWDVDTGKEAVLNDPSNFLNYLGGITDPLNQFRALSIQDTTILLNKDKVVDMNAPTTDELDTVDELDYRVTARLYGDPASQYFTFNLVSIDDQTIGEFTFQAPSGSYSFYDFFAGTGLTDFQTALNQAASDMANPGGGTANPPMLNFDFTPLSQSCVIEETSSTPKPWRLEVIEAGDGAPIIKTFKYKVDNLTDLPAESVDGYRVEIQNTSSALDNWWAKFNADDGDSGSGFWTETRSPLDASTLNASTMPIELVFDSKDANTGVTTFNVEQISWTARDAGDDVTCPLPSFINNKIEHIFLEDNRLGFLSKDNIFFSKAGDFFNLFYTSAQTLTDADPIDINCSAVKDVTLDSVISTPQGLVCFAKDQQFLLYSDTGVLTPTSTAIRTLSTFERYQYIDPVEIGTSSFFINRMPNDSRLMAFSTSGREESPQVVDVSDQVKSWIPADIDRLTAAAQSNTLILSNKDSEYAYVFRFSTDQNRPISSWVKWKLNGDIKFIHVDGDRAYIVLDSNSKLQLIQCSLSKNPEVQIINAQGLSVNPCIDMYRKVATGEAEVNGGDTFIKVGHDHSEGTPIVVIDGNTTSGDFNGPGTYFLDPREVSYQFTGDPTASDALQVAGVDLTDDFSNLVVGYAYDFDVELPRYFYRPNPQVTDFTAALTMSRMKFSTGLSGGLSFRLRSRDRYAGQKTFTIDASTPQGTFGFTAAEIPVQDPADVKAKLDGVEYTNFTIDGPYANNQYYLVVNGGGSITGPASLFVYVEEWVIDDPVPDGASYLADDAPLDTENIYTVPIHQRTENFTLRMFNNSPFPIAINSLMWEGKYSPRFFRRA